MLSTADFVSLVLKNTTSEGKTPLIEVLEAVQSELGRETVPKLDSEGNPQRDQTGKVIKVVGEFNYPLDGLKTKYAQLVTTLKAGKASLKVGGKKLDSVGQGKLAKILSDRVEPGRKGRQAGDVDPSLLEGLGLLD